MVAVLNYSGEMMEKLLVESGSEISGLYVWQESGEKEEEVMLVSAGCKVYRVPLKKGEEDSKMEDSIVLNKSA